MTEYRALISVPITADSGGDAWEKACNVAHAVRASDGAINGHVELLGELDDELRVARFCDVEPDFLEMYMLDQAADWIRGFYPCS